MLMIQICEYEDDMEHVRLYCIGLKREWWRYTLLKVILTKMNKFKITSFHFYFQLYLYFPPHPHQVIIHLDNLYLRWKRKRFFIFYLVIGGSNLLYYWCWRKGEKNNDLTAFVRQLPSNVASETEQRTACRFYTLTTTTTFT